VRIRRAAESASWQSRSHPVLTAPGERGYSRIVSVKKIQVGQVWKKDDGGESFLVTKVYSEALATYAVLRKAGAEGEPPVRVKVSKNGASASLPGFTYTQGSGEF
jgi:hypothetical protein